MNAMYARELFIKTFGREPAPPRPANQPRAEVNDKLAPAPEPETEGRVIYHVTPRAHDGRWNIKVRGTDDPIAVIDNKDDAVERAKKLARRHDWSQLIVHNQDGKIAHEFAYGASPDETGFEPADEDDDDSPDDTDAPGGDTQQATKTERVADAKPAVPADRIIYHVMLRKSDNRWTVLKQGRAKPNRVLVSQAEAIEFAMTLARSEGEAWVITHEEDGAIAEEIHVKQ